jgi:hypothetical protein
MLVDSIKRYNGQEHLKLVNVEHYKAKGVSIPAQIHSVPALLFPETKKVIFGKQVFDFLLLPNKGYLFNLPKKESGPVAGGEISSGDPMSFSLTNGLSDSYSFIDADKPDPHKSYVWSGVDENIVIPTTIETEKESKRGQSLPDVGSLKSQRDLQLQDFLT